VKHDCPNCYYRNSSWVGGIEISASCDHPNFLPEGKVLYPEQLQSPDWCPLGVAQPLKRDVLIDLPESPMIQENPELGQELSKWFDRGNMTHGNSSSYLERAIQSGLDSIREAEDDRIISELHAQAVREYQQAFNKIAESGFDHHRKLDEAEDNEDP
jgi:hypothetical protein